MSKSIQNIDHIGLAASDMRKNESLYRKLGFNITRPEALYKSSQNSDDAESGQHSQHVMFSATYIELTGVVDPAKGSYVGRFLDKFDGLHIVCFSTNNADITAELLLKEGVRTSSIQESSRKVNYGLGGTARFKWFVLDPERTREGLICVVQHLTPDQIFCKEVTHHDNGSKAVTEVKICTEDVDSHIELYQSILGISPHDSVNGLCFEMQKTKLTIIDNNKLRELYPGATAHADIFLAGYTISVENIDQTETYFRENGIRYSKKGSNLWIPSKLAGGAIIEFTE